MRLADLAIIAAYLVAAGTGALTVIGVPTGYAASVAGLSPTFVSARAGEAAR